MPETVRVTQARRIVGRFSLAALLLVACNRDDGRVIISGDVEGLDTIALRGDSLLAAADRLPAVIDSLRALSAGRSRGATSGDSTDTAPAGAPSSEAVPQSGGAALTQRAQARGDSMARAEAMRLAGGAGSGARSAADSLRGVLSLTGGAPASQLVLQVGDGRSPVALSGMATGGLRRLEGAEVVVRGVRVGPRDLVVSDFSVRAVDGVPAYDGLLSAVDGGYVLTLSDGSGRMRLDAAPAGLRALAGSRVWISMRAGTSAPVAFGPVVR